MGLFQLASVKQRHDEFIDKFIRRFREAKNQSCSLNISEKDLAKFAFNVLRSHLKEKLDGHYFANVNQVFKRTLAQESRGKEYSHKSDRPNMHMLNYDSLGDEDKDVYASKSVCPSKSKPCTCASLKPIHKNWQEEMIFTFDVSKYERFFMTC